MKNLKDCFVKEGKQVQYRVSLTNCNNKHVPVSVTILVDPEDAEAFAKYLEDEQDNLFIHAEGPGVEF